MPSANRMGVALDVVITYILYFIVGLVGLVLEGLFGPDLGTVLAGLLGLAMVVFVVVWQLLSLGRLGQTYGKHLAGVRVVSTRDGGPIGGGSAFARQLVQTLGLYALGLGWFWALWDPQQQGWHDKVVSSVVVDASQERRVDPFAHMRAAFLGRW